MLLRRVIDHVTQQNWFAILLDFMIVVLGVFIGIQLGNWNTTLQTRSAFKEAQARLVAESTANLETTDGFLDDVRSRLNSARTSIARLRDCDTSPTAEAEILAGVNIIRGTATLRLRQTALDAITGNTDFLSLLDEKDRENLKEFQRRLRQAQSTLDWLEERPFTKHIEDTPYVMHGMLTPLSESMPNIQLRPLQLATNLPTLCNNTAFLAPFYLWERTSTFQLLRAEQVRDLLARRVNTDQ